MEAAASSQSAPEPSTRVASPTRAHSSRLRPASASPAVPVHPRVSQFEQSLAQAADHDSAQADIATGSGDTSTSERQDSGLAGDFSQLCGHVPADSRAAIAGHASIIEAVAAAQQQADDGSREQQGGDGARRQSRPESAAVQHKLLSPHWQRKSPSQIQQHLEDKHAAAAQRRSLQQVQKKARQARAEAGRQAVQNGELERKVATEQQLQQKQARKAELRDAHLRQIRRKALNETTKVHEVLFINKLQKEDKELTLIQRMQDAERRQAEGRAKQQQRQKEMEAAQQEAQERRHLLEEQKLLKLAEKGRRATAVALKLEEERRAGESARLAKAEQQRAVQQQQKQIAQEHTQQLEARLSQRLQEAAQRRVSHLHQIRERAAISKEEKEACPPMSPPKTHRGAFCLHALVVLPMFYGSHHRWVSNLHTKL
ncbi:hypothetical protein ABBQ32_001270 [Trebouxia sp. C0010 RCD-2024]